MRAFIRRALWMLLCVLASSLWAQSPFAPKVTGPLSQRVVAYRSTPSTIPRNTRLMPPRRSPITTSPASRSIAFPFHLYLNALSAESRPGCTKRIATAISAPAALEDWKPKDYGSNEVTSLEVVGMGDLTKQMKFVSPDDGNPDDKTVFEVQLPRPVPPGQDVVFKIKFHASFPEVIARTGYKRTFLLAGQWFPKVGVWWHGAWNCHQFHALTEFFADFGTYDVNITLPKNYVIGATGVQTAERDNGNGTKTVAFHAEDVHDFAWTADPNFKVVEERVRRQRGPGEDPPADLRSHKSSWQRYIDYHAADA